MKNYVIIAAIALGLGSLCGYYLTKLESAQGKEAAPIATVQSAQQASAIQPPATRSENLPDRQLLELKLALCLNRRLDRAMLNGMSDRDLNNLTFDACQSAGYR